jgi:hypothetical protein
LLYAEIPRATDQIEIVVWAVGLYRVQQMLKIRSGPG